MSQLKKTLGTTGLTFYGIGMILGAGVYSVIGAGAAKAGGSLWLSFLISSLVVSLTAFSYAELGTLFPEAGAEYVYLRKAFPRIRVLGFVTALLVALSGAATAATVSMAFSGYLQQFVEFPEWVASLSLLISLGIIAMIGIQESSWVNIFFTLVEAAGLVLFIGLGIQAPEFGSVVFETPNAGIFTGAALVFFSFLGFENIANLTEEAKDAGKSLPIAIVISLVVTSFLYVLVALAAVALASVESLSQSASPLATAAKASSPLIAKTLSGVALFATANTALISLIVTSRILFSISRKGELPKALQKTLTKRKTPWIATLIVLSVSTAFLPLGKIDIVASVSSLASLIAFASVNVSVIVLRFIQPKTKRVFRVPFSIGKLPVVPVLGLLCILALMTQFEILTYGIGAVAIAVFILFYFILPKQQKSET